MVVVGKCVAHISTINACEGFTPGYIYLLQFFLMPSGVLETNFIMLYVVELVALKM